MLAQVIGRIGPVKFAPSETSLSHADALMAARTHGVHTLGGCMIRWRSTDIMIGREAAALDGVPPMPLVRTSSGSLIAVASTRLGHGHSWIGSSMP